MRRLVRISAWRPDLQKVSMTLVVRRLAQLDLGVAKSVTDRVLVGEVVDVEVGDPRAAQELAQDLQALGAVAEVVDHPA